MDVQTVSAGVGIAIDPVDVIVAVEGVAEPRIPLAVVVDRPAVKEHDGHEEAPLAGADDPGPQSIEVLGIELSKVEAAGFGARPDGRANLVSPGFMSPETDEVVSPRREPVEVALEVKGARTFGVVEQDVPVM